MLKDKLNSLKSKANISCAEWSKLSTVPEVTIRKILSGETPDPRFDTVFKLVNSVGGSMDDVFGGKKETEIENNAVMVLKDTYETKISYLVDYMESLKQDKKMLIRALSILVIIIIGVLILDIALDTNGWFQ
jgi:hypothetical protein